MLLSELIAVRRHLADLIREGTDLSPGTLRAMLAAVSLHERLLDRARQEAKMLNDLAILQEVAVKDQQRRADREAGRR